MVDDLAAIHTDLDVAAGQGPKSERDQVHRSPLVVVVLRWHLDGHDPMAIHNVVPASRPQRTNGSGGSFPDHAFLARRHGVSLKAGGRHCWYRFRGEGRRRARRRGASPGSVNAHDQAGRWWSAPNSTGLSQREMSLGSVDIVSTPTIGQLAITA